MDSANIRTQAYTAVVCIAVLSFTDLPDDVPPKRKLNELPTLFCGLSREWNRPENMLIGIILLKLSAKKAPVSRCFQDVYKLIFLISNIH